MGGHRHHTAAEQLSGRERLTSIRAWSDVAHNFRGDWQMLWKELALNDLGVVIFAVLFWLTARRGATDPVCGMKVDRDKAVTKQIGGEAHYFCSTHCQHSFEADPEKYRDGTPSVDHGHAAHAHHGPKPESI